MWTIRPTNTHLVIAFTGHALLSIAPPSIIAESDHQHQGDAWHAHQDQFRSTCDLFTAVITPTVTAHHIHLTLAITFKRGASLRSVFLPQSFHVAQLHCLDRSYALRPVTDALTIDSLTPAYLYGQQQGHEQWFDVYHYRHGAVVLKDADGHTEVYLDDEALHPRTLKRESVPSDRSQHRAYENQTLHLETRLCQRHPDTTVALPWRYPAGADACFVITDHADWDVTDGLHALYTSARGFNRTRVRTTKSVFSASVGRESPDKPFQPDGLDVPAYAQLMDTLHEAGHEICPHSIVVRPTTAEPIVPLKRVVDALDMFARRYQSGTWIDHGKLEGQAINYSQLGWMPDGKWNLTGLLEERGFNTIWAYVDQMEYPVQNINQLELSDTSVDYLRATLREWLARNGYRGFNYLKLAAQRQLGQAGHDDLRAVINFLKLFTSRDYTRRAKLKRFRHLSVPALKAMVSALYILLTGKGHTETRIAPYPTLYAESALPLSQANPDTLTLFATVRVNMYQTSWRKLDQLIDEHGIHLAHTYLCNTSSTVVDPTVQQTNGKWSITPEFAELLDILDEHIAHNRLWNPTMKACAAWFSKWAHVSVVPVAPHAVQITNPTDTMLTDYTLTFTRAVRHITPEARQVGDAPPRYSIDLPPQTTIDVRWDANDGV